MVLLFRLFLLLTALFTTEAYANPIQNMGLCKAATHQVEKKMNIPSNLLRAISLTESGRWIEKDKANIAWPWTVSSGGPGIYFNTKTEAIDHVRKLQAKGVTNIDIGCMQINLFYHGDAFKDLNDAFDPDHNAKYAGDFLTRLFKETKSWTAAAGRYHSSEPSKGMYYREKVIAYWNQSSKEDHDETQHLAETERKDQGYKIASIDTDRTALLNNNFKKRLNIQEAATTRAEKMSAQVSNWRNSRGLSNYNDLNAARQKALYQQKVKKTLMVPNTPQRSLTPVSFENRRSAQLDKWRRTVANPEIVALAEQPRTEANELPMKKPRTLLEQ
jgi:hypothetical protein